MPSAAPGKLPQPIHDNFFHRMIMSKPRALQGLLSGALPKALADVIDWEHPPEVKSAKLGTEAGGQLMADGWARLRLGSGQRLNVVIEHKSEAVPELPQQLLAYVAEICKLTAGFPGAKRGISEPVIALVVSHANVKWNVSRMYADAVAPLSGSPFFFKPAARQSGFDESLGRDSYLSGLEGYHLLDLIQVGEADMPKDEFLRGVLAALKWQGRDGITKEGQEAIAGLFTEPDVFEHAVLYADEALKLEPEHLLETMAGRERKRVMGTLMEFFERKAQEQFYEMGKADGKAEGRAEGKAEGKAEGMVDLVSDFLRRRFGKLPDWARERLQAADSAALKQIHAAAMTAQSLESAFASAPGNSS